MRLCRLLEEKYCNVEILTSEKQEQIALFEKTTKEINELDDLNKRKYDEIIPVLKQKRLEPVLLRLKGCYRHEKSSRSIPESSSDYFLLNIKFSPDNDSVPLIQFP